jgi:hypothetical protein
LNYLLQEVDAWVTVLIMMGALLAAWGAGYWRGHRLPPTPDAAPEGKFTDASLALLGLLLAFTFSMSLGKHEQRRVMVVADSNAVGDFYTCATLLKGPTRPKLQAVIREYAQLKVDATRRRVAGEDLERVLRQAQVLQGRMTDLVAEAVHAGTPVVVPLTNTLNNLTSSHASRLEAFRDRLPWSIVLLLFLSAAVAVLLLGEHQGASRKPMPLGTLSFIALVVLVVYATLDLNQPGHGLITVSQESFERLLSSMAP